MIMIEKSFVAAHFSIGLQGAVAVFDWGIHLGGGYLTLALGIVVIDENIATHDTKGDKN